MDEHRMGTPACREAYITTFTTTAPAVKSTFRSTPVHSRLALHNLGRCSSIRVALPPPLPLLRRAAVLARG